MEKPSIEIVANVEAQDDGFSAHLEIVGCPIATTGRNLVELKANIKEAINAFLEYSREEGKDELYFKYSDYKLLSSLDNVTKLKILGKWDEFLKGYSSVAAAQMKFEDHINSFTNQQLVSFTLDDSWNARKVWNVGLALWRALNEISKLQD